MKWTLLTCCVLLLGTNPAEARKPYLDLDAETSFDGLYPVKRAKMDQAWARDDVDLSGYTKLMIVNAGLHFRPVDELSGPRSTAARSRTEFPVTEAQKENLREILRDSFTKELSKLDRFEIVDTPGPDVLMLRGAVVDIVSNVPPEPMGRSEIYLTAVGSAVLVVELIDSQSNAVLVRAVDGRTAEARGFPMEMNTVTNRFQIGAMTQQWARLVRQALERFVGVDEEGRIVREKG